MMDTSGSFFYFIVRPFFFNPEAVKIEMSLHSTLVPDFYFRLFVIRLCTFRFHPVPRLSRGLLRWDHHKGGKITSRCIQFLIQHPLPYVASPMIGEKRHDRSSEDLPSSLTGQAPRHFNPSKRQATVRGNFVSHSFTVIKHIILS